MGTRYRPSRRQTKRNPTQLRSRKTVSRNSSRLKSAQIQKFLVVLKEVDPHRQLSIGPVHRAKQKTMHNSIQSPAVPAESKRAKTKPTRRVLSPSRERRSHQTCTLRHPIARATPLTRPTRSFRVTSVGTQRCLRMPTIVPARQARRIKREEALSHLTSLTMGQEATNNTIIYSQTHPRWFQAMRASREAHLLQTIRAVL